MQLAHLTGTTGAGLARSGQRKATGSTSLQAARHCAPVAAAARRHWGGRWQRVAAAAGSTDPAAPAAAEQGDEGGLLPEEDEEIPGSYRDAMSSNTQLGKAVKGACDELDALGALERQTLEEAEDLLKKLGFKGSLFEAPQQQAAGQQEADA